MPVDTKAQAVQDRTPQWERCRAAVAGQDAVRKLGQTYLPALTEQTPEEYRSYLIRTPWYGATGRTLEGAVGMVFAKNPVLEAPATLAEYAADITMSGITLDGLARQILTDVETVGRFGCLVEYPLVREQPASRAAAEAANLRPYVSTYTAEQIINWRLARVNNAMQPVLIVLCEEYEPEGALDDFARECKTQYRVLRLDANGYRQEIWREGVIFGAPIVPLMAGKPLQAIPFYPFGPEELSMRVQSPPMLDLVDLNFSHFRTSADLEHGAHFTGLPTPVLAGFDNTRDPAGNIVPIRIGSSQAIVGPQGAQATYLEFSGTGLGALEKLLDRKEAQMAALGARMLAPEKSGIEASDTLAMRHNGENSVLGGVVRLVSYGITEMLRFMSQWAGLGGEVKYTMNTDFMPRGLTAQDVTALVSAWQQGAISQQVLFGNLQRGEIIDADDDLETMQAQIGDAAPVAPAAN